MTMLFVVYSGDASTRFDRAYYVETHMKMVREAWGRHGLEGADAFFPAGDGGGTIAMAVIKFRDDAALAAALGAPETPAVMADVTMFTDAGPVPMRGAPLG